MDNKWGMGTMKRTTQEKEYEQLLEAAHGGNGEAIYQLARMYYFGTYVSRDHIKAFKYYEQAFAAGVDMDGDDYIYMANDRELNGDYFAALELYRMAVEKGEELGYEGMGIIYFQKEDYEKAWKYFNKLEEESICALYHIGYMYEKGLGAPKDTQKARFYYETAIEEATEDPEYFEYIKLDDYYKRTVEAIRRLDQRDNTE